MVMDGSVSFLAAGDVVVVDGVDGVDWVDRGDVVGGGVCGDLGMVPVSTFREANPFMRMHILPVSSLISMSNFRSLEAVLVLSYFTWAHMEGAHCPVISSSCSA